MKCADCGQEILQTHPEMCPYCRSKNLISEEDAAKEIGEAEKLAKAGHYEKAALLYEKLDLWKEAKECRMQAKKKQDSGVHRPEGKVSVVTVACPQCGFTQPADVGSEETICNRCGTTYVLSKRVRELLLFDKSS